MAQSLDSRDIEAANEFRTLIAGFSHAVIPRVHQPSCSEPDGPKDLLDGGFTGAWEVGRVSEDTDKARKLLYSEIDWLI
jgi:hypothetical protein